MFFGHGVDANQGEDKLKTGETATVKYEGDRALFDDANSFITGYGVFGKFELVSVSWISGEITDNSEDDIVWSPVETVKYNDVPTVENGTKYNYVDITVPKGGGPYPVVFWIHGGGWSQLDRTSFFISDTREYLLSKGYAIVSAEYTLCESAGEDITSGYPQMVYDLKTAVRFIRANADKYNLDTSFIAAMGESAGAHLAMLLGTTNSSKAHEDLSMGNAGFSSDVQAMVSYFGPSDLVDNIMGYAVFGSSYTEELGKAASPYYQITKNAPPLFLTHGENDAAVPIEHSYKMEQKAKELIGAKNVTSIYYADAPHASKAAFDKSSAMQAVEVFLATQLANSKSDSAAVNPTTGDNSVNYLVAAIVAMLLSVLCAGVLGTSTRKKNALS
jgi:acetyl esterase/lipase